MARFVEPEMTVPTWFNREIRPLCRSTLVFFAGRAPAAPLLNLLPISRDPVLPETSVSMVG
jgi:hypothetical protein